MTDTPRKLVDMDLDEISGVDHPAHLSEGWALLKSADIPEDFDIDAIIADASQIAKSHDELTTALEKAAEEYLSEAPDEVKMAANVLHDYLKSMKGHSDDEDEDAPTDDEDDEDDAEAKTPAKKGLLARFFEWVTKAQEEELEKAGMTKCPKCDHPMQKGGACSHCGYSEDESGKGGDPAVEKARADNLLTDILAAAAVSDPEVRKGLIREAVVKFAGEEAESMSAEILERLTKAIEGVLNTEAPAAEAPATEVTKAAEADGISAEDVSALAKAIAEAIAPEFEAIRKDNEAVRDAFVKALDRVETLEKATVGRRSLPGQDLVTEGTTRQIAKAADGEGEGLKTPIEKARSGWGGVIQKAMSGEKVSLGG